LAKIDDVIDSLERLNNEIMSLRRSIVPLLPLPPVAKPLIGRTAEGLDPIIADAYFTAVREVIQSVEDAPMNLRTNLIEPARAAPAKIKKARTKAQKRNDNLQSRAFKTANDALRKNNGVMRKGVDQKMIAARAQRELRKLKKVAPKRAKKAIKSVRRRVKR